MLIDWQIMGERCPDGSFSRDLVTRSWIYLLSESRPQETLVTACDAGSGRSIVSSPSWFGMNTAAYMREVGAESDPLSSGVRVQDTTGHVLRDLDVPNLVDVSSSSPGFELSQKGF
jgi:hypothetical protein